MARRALLAELDPVYAAVILERAAVELGLSPVRVYAGAEAEGAEVAGET